MDILSQRRWNLLKPKLFDAQTRNPTTNFSTATHFTSFHVPYLPGVRNAFIDQIRQDVPSKRTRAPRKTEISCNSGNIEYIKDDVERIGNSLEQLKTLLDSEYRDITREFDNRIRLTDVAVTSDINAVRHHINTLSSVVGSNDSGIDDTRSQGSQDGSSYNPNVVNLGLTSEYSPAYSFKTDCTFHSIIDKDRSSPGVLSFDSGIYHDYGIKHEMRTDDGILSNYQNQIRECSWQSCVDNTSVGLVRQAYSNWHLEKHEHDPALKGCEDAKELCKGQIINSFLNAAGYLNSPRNFNAQRNEKETENEDRRLNSKRLSNSGSRDTDVNIDTNVSRQNRTPTPCIDQVKGILKFNTTNTREKYPDSPYNGYSAVLYDACFFGGITLSNWRKKISDFLSSVTGQSKQSADTIDTIDENKEFREDMVSSHNAFRVFHGSPEMNLSDELNKDAQMWADIIAEKGFVQYSELPGRGENVIFVDTNGVKPSGAEVTKHWYAQQKNYDFNDPRWRKGAIHFTQMIWRSSTEIGIGLAKLKDHDKTVIVAQYRPVGNGNMPGEFRKNVLRPQ